MMMMMMMMMAKRKQISVPLIKFHLYLQSVSIHQHRQTVFKHHFSNGKILLYLFSCLNVLTEDLTDLYSLLTNKLFTNIEKIRMLLQPLHRLLPMYI